MKTLIKKLLRKNFYLWKFAFSIKSIIYHYGGGLEVYNHGCARIKRSVVGKNNTLTIGQDSIIHNLDVFIRGNSIRIEIGNGVIIGKGCSIRCEGDNIKVIVGNNTTMTRDVHICAQENESCIVIGEDCMFSNNIIIRTSDSHPIYDISGIRINLPQNVRIGNHVWIAPESTILKGVIISDNAIVGSKSLVTKDVESSCLYAGIPAHVIKRNINWTRGELF